MAYDKAVQFKCVKKLDNYEDTLTFKFTNCGWGWLVDDKELSEFIELGELEFKKELSPFETLLRFEKNYNQYLAEKKSKLQELKNIYDRYKEKQILRTYKNLYQDFESYENLIYDKRVVNVTFHKYWWESGLN